MTEADKALARLREPFPDHQVNLLPKQVRRDDKEKGKCQRGSQYTADGVVCDGYHARSVHLSYVGHAALTDRFLDVDPMWTWEPVSYTQEGLPAFDREGGLWIRLTVCGVTRLGYGDAQGKSGPNAIKEAIGDALRNAGMRFGAALDLWHKGDLHDVQVARGNVDPDPEPKQRPKPAQPVQLDENLFNELMTAITDAPDVAALNRAGGLVAKAEMPSDAKAALRSAFTTKMADIKAGKP